MTRSFSLATLMLVMAIAAIGLASVRTTAVRVAGGESSALMGPLVVGAIGGALYGFALAIWQRAGFIRLVAGVVGGLCIGVAAGAQATSPVGWPVVFTAPVVLVGMAALIGANRRRSLRLLATKGASAAIEERPFGGPCFQGQASPGDSA
jgi:hypothetical protein